MFLSFHHFVRGDKSRLTGGARKEPPPVYVYRLFHKALNVHFRGIEDLAEGIVEAIILGRQAIPGIGFCDRISAFASSSPISTNAWVI